MDDPNKRSIDKPTSEPQQNDVNVRDDELQDLGEDLTKSTLPDRPPLTNPEVRSSNKPSTSDAEPPTDEGNQEEIAAEAYRLTQKAELCIEEHNYTDAIELLMRIDDRFRSSRSTAMLSSAVRKQDEVDLLFRHITSSLRRGKTNGMVTKLQRLLHLKPDDPVARYLFRRFRWQARYGLLGAIASDMFAPAKSSAGILTYEEPFLRKHLLLCSIVGILSCVAAFTSMVWVLRNNAASNAVSYLSSNNLNAASSGNEVQKADAIDAAKVSEAALQAKHYALVSPPVLTVPGVTFDGSHPITVESWMKVNEKPLNYSTIVPISFSTIEGPNMTGFWIAGQKKKDSDTWNWTVHCSKGGVGWGIEVKASETLLLHKWVHIAAAVDGRNIKLFIDGKLSGSDTLSEAILPSNDSLVLGGVPRSISKGSPATTYWHEFSGYLDEIRISRSSRYSVDFTPSRYLKPDDDTIALFHCDEGQGLVLNDSSGNDNHGRLTEESWFQLSQSDPTFSRENDSQSYADAENQNNASPTPSIDPTPMVSVEITDPVDPPKSVNVDNPKPTSAATRIVKPSERIYVAAANRSGNHDGKSWSTAYNSLQDALKSMRKYPNTAKEVWIANGKYYADVHRKNRDSTFELVGGVAYRGGFIGNESSLAQRKSGLWSTKTFFTGDLAGNDSKDSRSKDDNTHRIFTVRNQSKPTYIELIRIDRANNTRGDNRKSDSPARGGGLFIYHSPVFIKNCHINECKANGHGGGVYIHDSDVKFEKALINASRTNNSGAAIFADQTDKRTTILTACELQFSHEASQGAHLYHSNGTARVTNCRFWYSHCKYGGSIFSRNTKLQMTNCLIYENRSSKYPAGMIVANGSKAIVTNCTFARNSTSRQYTTDLWAEKDALAIVRNSILFSGSGVSVFSDKSSTLDVAHSCIVKGVRGPGVINNNPKFVSEKKNNFRLQSSSPCIDKGNLSLLPIDSLDFDQDRNTKERFPFDFDRKDRKIGLTVDMGAYEYTYQ